MLGAKSLRRRRRLAPQVGGDREGGSVLSCGWGEGAPEGVMQSGATHLGLEWQDFQTGHGSLECARRQASREPQQGRGRVSSLSAPAPRPRPPASLLTSPAPATVSHSCHLPFLHPPQSLTDFIPSGGVSQPTHPLGPSSWPSGNPPQRPLHTFSALRVPYLPPS